MDAGAPPPTVLRPHPGPALATRYRRVRSLTDRLTAVVSAEDAAIQSMPDVSPTRWHLAHTSWFFETFVLAAAEPGYRPFHPAFHDLFNSYYQSVGTPFPRTRRGLLSRPSLEEVRRYRAVVDERMVALLARDDGALREVLPVVELGLHHEQQHQELLLTDLQHVFAQNPLAPAYATPEPSASPDPGPARWLACPGGLVEIGHAGPGFAFDNEGPRHKVHLEPYALASRLVTNAEVLAFLEDDGYRRHEHWLSLGWDRVRAEGWEAPLSWSRVDGAWMRRSLHGLVSLDLHAPATHLSLFEADAIAAWSGARLATEAEWEAVAAHAPVVGNLLPIDPDAPRALAPRPPPPHAPTHLPAQLFGDAWEWTSSAYAPYPRFRPWSGALGEYNGKFMCSQYVLRGGSWATPADHIRATYRNFFPPETRWQVTGVRLARDAG